MMAKRNCQFNVLDANAFHANCHGSTFDTWAMLKVYAREFFQHLGESSADMHTDFDTMQSNAQRAYEQVCCGGGSYNVRSYQSSSRVDDVRAILHAISPFSFRIFQESHYLRRRSFFNA